MSARSHTPGPWHVVGGTEVRAGVRIIADTDGAHRIDDQREADARLIAAAPDLLEAARFALAALADPTRLDRRGDALAKLEAATAKARGPRIVREGDALVDVETGLRTAADWRCPVGHCRKPIARIEDTAAGCICERGHAST